jgi:hypothetical protein
MRAGLLIIATVLCICSGCRRHFTLQKSEVLGANSAGEVIVEEWQGDTLMEQPVWRVYLRPSGTSNMQALFTVEAEFQESEPGYPHLVSTNGIQVVQDHSPSYIFSLASRDFLTNRWEGSTYLGDLRPRK